jgi:hypothetical protein
MRCSWCGATATGSVTAKGLDAPLYDCGSLECWERSYKTVRGMVPRTWKLISRPTGRKRAPQAGPDLFDLLPDGRDTV